MAFNKFDKRDEERHQQILNKLNDTKAALETAIAEFNEKMPALFDEIVKPKVDAYNEQVNEANGFLEDMNNAAQEHFDEKSERWQEGEKGSAYQEWITELEARLEEAEIVAPGTLDEPDFDSISTFEDIKRSPED